MLEKPRVVDEPFSSSSNSSSSSLTPVSLPTLHPFDSFPTYPSNYPSEITSVHFDQHQELVWVGHASGNVRSFIVPQMASYTARQIDYNPILDIMTYQRFHQGILVLTSDYVKLLHRRGLQGFSIPAYASPRKPFLAMTYASNRPTHELVVSTHAPSLEIIHIHRGERMPSLNIDLPSVSPVQCMRGVDTHTFLTAHAQGTLSLIDARTWKSVGSMAVHSGGFSDVLVYDPCTVYTSGLTSSITVLDLRMLARCGYVPLYQPHRFSRWDPFVIALSETQVHWLQASTYQCTQTFLLDTWATSLDVSMSHDFIALGDAQGHLHVVSTTMPPTPPSHSTHPATTSTTTTTAPATRTTTNSHTPPPSFHSVNPSSSSSPSSPCVNVMSEPVALPSYIYPMPKIPFHPQVPLNLLGVPPCTSYLSGETWPTSLPRSTHLLTAPLDPSFLMHAKWTSGGAIGFVPKPPHALRQRWPYTTKEVLPTHLFKSTLQHHSHSKKKMSPKAYDTTTPTPTSTTAASLPRTSCVMEDYKKMSIQYSKFGVHDFNFHFFNPTTWSGLETDVEHMYVNNYLQTLHFSTPLNRLAMTHAYTICEKETCLLCETGFLFRTLQQAKGLNCRTTHWSYVFGQLPDTDVLNLREHPNVPFPSLAITLQHCARYLMDLFHKESDQGCQEYLTRIETLATCSQCRQTQEKPANVFLIDLNYPGRRSNFLDTSFVDILKDSLISSSSNRGWCDHCKQYITLCKRKSVIQFPTVIQLACHVKSDWNTDWWCSQETTFLNTSIPPFLPEKIWLSIHHGEVHCKLPNDDDEEKEDDVYTLTAVTCEVTDAEPHIISHIRIRDDEWYLFNDFRVRQVPATHVFQFPKWKIPCVLQYTKLTKLTRSGWVSPVWTKSTFLEESNVLNPGRCAPLPHPLQLQEIHAGFQCAIDTEYVCLREEVAEYASDGTKHVLKPAHLTLARVSMVRGNGPEQGTVCLDDFVMPKAPVIDYLTPYSGITPEDLNPSTSRQRLVTLKTVYRKLRYMVDHGVHFIGHDLVQDFRILHLTVPTSQLLDTVHLYSQPTWHRKLSLKFLAWAVLGLHVQVTTHDSIEDATIALHLYQKYVSMDSSQQWQALIQNVYRLGALHGYRPPPPPSEETKRVSTLAS